MKLMKPVNGKSIQAEKETKNLSSLPKFSLSSVADSTPLSSPICERNSHSSFSDIMHESSPVHLNQDYSDLEEFEFQSVSSETSFCSEISAYELVEDALSTDHFSLSGVSENNHDQEESCRDKEAPPPTDTLKQAEEIQLAMSTQMGSPLTAAEDVEDADDDYFELSTRSLLLEFDLIKESELNLARQSLFLQWLCISEECSLLMEIMQIAIKFEMNCLNGLFAMFKDL